MFLTFWLGKVLRATTACTFSTSEPPKVVRSWCVLYIFTSKCASRHNGVHFCDISTSKSGPNVVCFVHFDLEMCFAPQRRALFRHLNFHKWSDHGVFCTFWLGNVHFRATTACTFSTSQLPKVLRDPGVLYLFTWKCASRHNGVQFVISHLASWLRPRRFSEPTFRPSGAPNHWKNSVSRLSYLFAHLHLLSSDSFSSTLLSSNVSLLSASALLCFSSAHIVGSLTSKLPSIGILRILVVSSCSIPSNFCWWLKCSIILGYLKCFNSPGFLRSRAKRAALRCTAALSLSCSSRGLLWPGASGGGKDTGLQKRCIYWYDQKVFKRTDIVNLGKSLNPCRSNPKRPTQFKHVWCNWRWFPPTSTNHQPGSHDVFDPSCGIILANRHGRPIRRGFALGEMPRWGQYMAPLRPPGQEFSTQGSSIPMPFSE